MLKKQKGFTLPEVIGAFIALAFIAIVIGVVSAEYYVIIHFIKKFW